MEWKVGILCASDAELAPFLPHVQNVKITESAMLKFYEGTINQVPAVLLYSGVCKVNAAIAAQILLDQYVVDAIINAGTAGGMDETVQIFDTIISTRIAYHDVSKNILTEFHPYMPSVYFPADPKLITIAKNLPARTEHPILFGPSVTGEQFIKDHKREAINKKYAPLSVDMESASVAHVCYVNKVPFLSIRTITDTASHSGAENFYKNCEIASQRSKEIVFLFLDELVKNIHLDCNR